MHAQRVVFPREHVQCYSKYDRRELQSRGEPGRRLRPTHLYFREYDRRERQRRKNATNGSHALTGARRRLMTVDWKTCTPSTAHEWIVPLTWRRT